ncbi:putative Bifunctional purine biosynthesis protein PURH [Cardiosporidium cionae]|uniref:Bifunctional purine biosynthesis protein PURH n=1 Tax=Cardiosporidium cionae TaxID=476202 RepID=A0ABQ7JFU6_9APIC|nr:putative Bifunctional purine biosynthesis protein PURH [Cardiosporidium cionae]|eukprot:KAF8822887.1 putative Bifunctional purine biosynthesis protein PURH [Cardiosporidium cionae]
MFLKYSLEPCLPTNKSFRFCNMPAEKILSNKDVSQVEISRISSAVISVFDKTGVEEIASFLNSYGIKIFSTGGTFKRLQALGISVEEISTYTQSPEVFDGRVKTLHPKIHGGILYCRGNESHEKEAAQYGIKPLDLVIANLYPFEKAVTENFDFATCMENIDIGGPCMIRAAAKNNSSVAVISSPSEYAPLMEVMKRTNGGTDLSFRKKMAYNAFRRTYLYDKYVTEYLLKTLPEEDYKVNPKTPQSAELCVREYIPEVMLKYGCNPHQAPAALCSINQNAMPFKILNGTPGYINLMDAALAFQLVHELKKISQKSAAASFKHCSPAGAALGRPLESWEEKVSILKLINPYVDKAYEITDSHGLSSIASAYILARNADPMSSFGDFVGVSDEVDESLASILKREVSDGIVAPSFSAKALDILKQKKSGKFVILQADPSFTPPDTEFRELFGMAFMQKRNALCYDWSNLSKCLSTRKDVHEEARLDLILASTCLKYTQSNSVAFSQNGQIIGVGAGQQSRVDCVKLAGRKVTTWFLRQHPKVLNLKFHSAVKRQDRINARVRYIEGDFTLVEYEDFCSKFTNVPEALSACEKSTFLKGLKGVSLSSDAFFPFRDSIDHASKLGVEFVAHPGGSVQDEQVASAANDYNMVMVQSAARSFLH